MDIRVEYFAQVKKAAGTGNCTVSLDAGSHLTDLLATLRPLHGEEFCSLVFDTHGAVLPSIMVTVNEYQVMPHDPVSLHPGDRVAILSPMSGG